MLVVKYDGKKITGRKTGSAIQPDGSEMIRITSKDFEGWFYSEDIEGI